MENSARSAETIPLKPEKSAPTTSIVNNQTGRLLDDTALMAKHALEIGALLNPDVVERIALLSEKVAHKRLAEGDMAEAARLYDQLSRIVGKVTPESLRATDNLGDGYWRTKSGRHIVKLWSITFLLGLAIFLYSMLEYRVSYFDLNAKETITEGKLFWVRLQHYANFFVPFIYGALGACAYLLRIVETLLKAREFDPRRIPQHWNRLALGTLSGGMIVMLVNEVPGAETSTVQISVGALGFIAGYSIDFLFQTLDRLINAVLPKTTRENSVTEHDKKLLLHRYQERLNNAQSEEEKKILLEIIGDLQS